MLDRKVAFDVGFMNYFFLALDWWLVLWQLVVISPSWLVCFCALHLKLQCVSVELPLLLLPCQFLGFVCKEGGFCRSVLANNLTGFLVSIYVDILSFSFSPFLSFPLSRSPLVGCWCVGSWVMVMKAMTAWSSPRTAWLSSLMLFVTFPPGPHLPHLPPPLLFPLPAPLSLSSFVFLPLPSPCHVLLPMDAWSRRRKHAVEPPLIQVICFCYMQPLVCR